MRIVETVTIVFVTLKLIGLITWSWWWVLSPILIVYLFPIGIVFIWFCATSIFSKPAPSADTAVFKE